MNKYYAGLADMVESSNNIKQTLKTVKDKLLNKLDRKYSNHSLNIKKEVKKKKLMKSLE